MRFFPREILRESEMFSIYSSVDAAAADYYAQSTKE